MRIALISEHASPLAPFGGPDAGGQNTHVAELSSALVEAGHDVRVYTRRDSRDLPPVVRTRDGVLVLHVPAGPARALSKDDLLPYVPEFGNWLAGQWLDGDWQPDVGHAHYWMSGLATLTAGRRAGVPVVQTYHALGTVKRRHLGTRDTSPAKRTNYERVLARGVDRVVAQSQDEVRELIQIGVPRGRMTVVPPGVNHDRFTPDGPAMPRDPRRPRVLTVARLVERKGIQDVVRAMRAVPEAECVVIGGPRDAPVTDDPFAQRLRGLAEDCGVADRFRLVGAVPDEDLPTWYRSADVLVNAPWYEPFGLTPLEAMACGVPVVGTAVGGLTDTVVDGLTGDLVPPRDPRALGVAVRRLLREPMRRFSYATAALDRVRNVYSWHRTAELLTAVYSGLSRRPTHAAA